MFWRDWLNGRGKWRIAGLHAGLAHCGAPQQSCAAGAKDVGNEATIATKALPSGASRGKYQHFENSDSRICAVGRLYCVLPWRASQTQCPLRERGSNVCGGTFGVGHHRAGAQPLNVAENPTGACYRMMFEFVGSEVRPGWVADTGHETSAAGAGQNRSERVGTNPTASARLELGKDALVRDRQGVPMCRILKMQFPVQNLEISFEGGTLSIFLLEMDGSSETQSLQKRHFWPCRNEIKTLVCPGEPPRAGGLPASSVLLGRHVQLPPLPQLARFAAEHQRIFTPPHNEGGGVLSLALGQRRACDDQGGNLRGGDIFLRSIFPVGKKGHALPHASRGPRGTMVTRGSVASATQRCGLRATRDCEGGTSGLALSGRTRRREGPPSLGAAVLLNTIVRAQDHDANGPRRSSPAGGEGG
eukprot:gene7874-biopygen18078